MHARFHHVFQPPDQLGLITAFKQICDEEENRFPWVGNEFFAVGDGFVDVRAAARCICQLALPDRRIFRLPQGGIEATKCPVLPDQDFLRVVDATPLVSIDLILRNARGEVLLGRRLNRPARDSWFVPGGRIRKNERVREALHRISEREIGVLIEEAELLGVFDHIYEDNFLGAEGVNTHYVVLGFTSRLPDGVKLTPDEQHGELRWWPVAEVLSSPVVHQNTRAYFEPKPIA